jgi:alkylated DNA nucleotide flippase Atl1
MARMAAGAHSAVAGRRAGTPRSARWVSQAMSPSVIAFCRS